MSPVRAAWLFGLLLPACAGDPAQPAFTPECTPSQFRACDADGCRGAQQCVEPGVWSRCFCTLLDASTPPPKDAAGEADAGDSGAD